MVIFFYMEKSEIRVSDLNTTCSLFIITLLSGLHDGDAKEKVFLQLLHDLPNENYYCIVAIVEHLVR